MEERGNMKRRRRKCNRKKKGRIEEKGKGNKRLVETQANTSFVKSKAGCMAGGHSMS